MAGRPRTGSKRLNPDGTMWASLQAAPGSRRRIEHTFTDPVLAERWLVTGLAALAAGSSPPDPRSYRLTVEVSTAPTATSFADVAWAWWNKHYIVRRKAGPTRAKLVKSRLEELIIPFFTSRVSDISEVSYKHVEEFIEYLAGYAPTSAPTKKMEVMEARLFTLQEAADAVDMSKSAVRRAWLLGDFPGGFKAPNGKIFIPSADLLAWKSTRRDPEVPAPVAYAKSTATEILQHLRGIFTYAIANDLMSRDPSMGQESIKPAPGARRFVKPNLETAKAIDLYVSRAIASELNIHHQLAFWLIRVGGLRISEVFGVRVGGIIRVDGVMLLTAKKQGGKQFEEWDDDGEIIKSDEKDSLKTEASVRTIPLASALSDLIEIYLEAFHNEEEEDPETRLFNTPGSTRQGAFLEALKKAYITHGLTYDNLRYRVSSHYLRKCCASDVVGTVPEFIRTVFLGHKLQGSGDGGAGVTRTVYTLEQEDIAQKLLMPQKQNEIIAATIKTLVVPTPISRLLPMNRRHSLEPMRQAIEALDRAGMVRAETAEDGDELLTPAEAAELLSCTPKTVDRWGVAGKLERRRIAAYGAMTGWGYTLASVQELMRIEAGNLTRRALCDQLGVDYTRLHRALGELGIKPVDGSRSIAHRYSAEDVARITAHFEALRTAGDGAVAASDAAALLGVHSVTVRRHLQQGTLVEDKEATASLKVTMVTRDSLDRLLKSRERRRTDAVHPEGTIPFKEAQKRTGLKRMDLLALQRRGLIIRRTRDYQFCVDEASLNAYLEGRL